MVDYIFDSLMSKKFRKYSVPEKNKAIIRAAIEKNVLHNEPIAISWPFGGYKLWRLEEAPESDWAELFTLIYIARWLAPTCAVYTPGVTFTFWFDEVVISMMNNIPQDDLDTYRASFERLLAFIRPLLPDTMRFETFLERSQYVSTDAFVQELAVAMEDLRRARATNPQPLSDSAQRSIEMNVRVTPEQAADPLWKEKVDLMHYAYYNLQESKHTVRPPYALANITAFTTFFEPNVIPIGTTKTSIVKFWVGIGALQKRTDGFIETILSPSQLDTTHTTWEPVHIQGLGGKNFNRIRIVV